LKRFNLKKSTGVEGKEESPVEVLNRFPALKDSDTEEDINSAL
jgi:hypothetical protein